MGTISVTNISDGTTADAADVNSQINTIVNEFNGNIDNANIKAAAAIATSKLADDAGITTAKITDLNITTAKLADAAVTPAKLLAGTGTSWVWQTWSPTYVNVTVGNGTVVAKYLQMGKTVFCEWNLLCGSTTAVGSSVTITVPVAAAARYTNQSQQSVGRVVGEDAGTKVWQGDVLLDNSTTVVEIRYDDGAGGLITTIPFTETTGDSFTATWQYEAA